MMVNPNYESFVMRTMNTQYHPRTLSEAFKDADYGTAIWRCETSNEKGVSALVWISTLVIVGVVLGVFVAPLLS